MYRNNPQINLFSALRQRPRAIAVIRGSSHFPEIQGNVKFYQTRQGVLVVTEVSGLPNFDDLCESPVFAFHIHEGNFCSAIGNDPFGNALSHYNPDDCLHPYHAGDLPPLFGNDGYAFQITLSNRFTVEEIIGKTIIIHSQADDFMTQPSGNSGEKIACGVIQ